MSKTKLKREWILDFYSSSGWKHDSKWTLMLLQICWMCNKATVCTRVCHINFKGDKMSVWPSHHSTEHTWPKKSVIVYKRGLVYHDLGIIFKVLAIISIKLDGARSTSIWMIWYVKPVKQIMETTLCGGKTSSDHTHNVGSNTYCIALAFLSVTLIIIMNWKLHKPNCFSIDN